MGRVKSGRELKLSLMCDVEFKEILSDIRFKTRAHCISDVVRRAVELYMITLGLGERKVKRVTIEFESDGTWDLLLPEHIWSKLQEKKNKK